MAEEWKPPEGYDERDGFLAAHPGAHQAYFAVLTWPVKSGAARVAACLLRLDGAKMKRRPGRTILAKLTGLDRKTIARGLKQLREAGFLKVGRNAKGKQVWFWKLPTQGAPKQGALEKNGSAPERGASEAARCAQNGGAWEAEKPKGDAPRFDQRCAPQRGPQGAPKWGAEVQEEQEEQTALGASEPAKAEPAATPDAEENRKLQQAKANGYDPAAVVEAAKRQAAELKASGDTELVHGLCRILGDGRVDHATWCRLDRLAVGRRMLKGGRRSITGMLLDIARQEVADGARSPPAAFVSDVRRRFPELGLAWQVGEVAASPTKAVDAF